MSEQQLKDFRAHAETLVEPPDFANLDRRGHELRVRRRAGVAGALAMVLALAGVLAQTHRTPAKDQPIQLPKLHSDARPYWTQGENLAEGTYWIRPSLLDHRLIAEFTVPPGWNGSWVGPQHSRDVRGDQSKSWYTNALVLEVDKVSTTRCLPEVIPLETRQEVAAALAHAFSTKLLQAPEEVERFGYPATRLRLQVTKKANKVCPDTASVTFHTTQDGNIPFAPPGTVLDLWIVDVDGRAIFVQRAHTPNAPPGAVAELDNVIRSIRFGTR